MTDHMREYSRRQFLKVTAAAGAAVGLGGIVAACSTAATPARPPRRPRRPARRLPAPLAATAAPSAAPTGTFNWMTWGDHWYQAQVDAIAASNNIKINATLFSDNIDAYTKVKQVGGQIDMVSGDALWVPHYFEAGLIEAWDINSLKVAKQLYSIARSIRDLDEAGRLPRLSLRVVAGPDLLRPREGLARRRIRWEVLHRPEVQEAGGRGEPAGRDHGRTWASSTGAENAYSMTPDEIAKAKELLKQAQAEHPEAGRPGHRHDRACSRPARRGSRPATSAPSRGSRTRAARTSRSSRPRKGPSAGWTPR